MAEYVACSLHPHIPNTALSGYPNLLLQPPVLAPILPVAASTHAESSTARRRAKRVASPDDEEVATGNGKRRRTATEVGRHPDLMDDIPSSLLQLYFLQKDKDNPIPCLQCKKMFSTEAILCRHGDCAVSVRDMKCVLCPVYGCKSRRVFPSCNPQLGLKALLGSPGETPLPATSVISTPARTRPVEVTLPQCLKTSPRLWRRLRDPHHLRPHPRDRPIHDVRATYTEKTSTSRPNADCLVAATVGERKMSAVRVLSLSSYGYPTTTATLTNTSPAQIAL
jgi:hypothetical protein